MKKNARRAHLRAFLHGRRKENPDFRDRLAALRSEFSDQFSGWLRKWSPASPSSSSSW
jgi:hypothetical protein